jgi:hypothetical protein
MYRSVATTRGFVRRALAVTTVAMLVVAILPTSARAAVTDPAAGYGAEWVVSGPDGLPRGDEKIAVGDDLHVAYAAVDGTAITSCLIRLTAIGGAVMDTPGELVGGACQLAVRLPDFPYPEGRLGHPAGSVALDFCVSMMQIQFADAAPRAMIAADVLEPGGRLCNNFSSPGPGPVLDFPIEPGGTPRPFVSVPPMVSWNPADWGTGMVSPTFGADWHYQLPAGIDQCNTYLNGSWQTVIRPQGVSGCQPWDLRLPGVLPSTMPWAGDAGDWYVELISDYTINAPGPSSWTMTQLSVPIEPTDGVFESSRPAVFPLDLATTRFVSVGEPWRPAFKISGATVATCTMQIYSVPPTFPVDPVTSEDHVVTPDADGVCTFDLPPLAEEWEFHQYYVYPDMNLGVDPGPNMAYGASIQAIPLPEPPVIEPPAPEPDGDTGIGVEPGDGQGLGMKLEVKAAPLIAANSSGDDGVSAAAAPVLCSDQAISTNLETGGAIPHLDASCGLAPGRYVATARMVDAAGVETTSQRTFTVAASPPHVSARTPASGATGVARDVRPTVTFDVPVTGVSATTFRLRDVATGTYVAAAVSYNATTRKATLAPSAKLGVGKTYRLYLTSGIKNALDAALVATNWSFRVSTDKTPPTIVGRSPGKGATGVSRTGNIAVRFSSAVRGVSASSLQLKDVTTGAFVPAVVTYNASTHRATLNPSAKLKARHHYLVVVRSSILDRAGNPLKKSTWSFTTRR